MPGATYGVRPPDAAVDTVVLHFSSDLPDNPADPFNVERICAIFTHDGVSAHYLIDREGTVYQLVPEEARAYHAGKGSLPWQPERTDQLNAHSIGIEMLAVGSRRDMRIFMPEKAYDDLARAHPEDIGFTDEQYASVAALLADIRRRRPAIRADRRHIVGHENYAPKRRTDPGELFEWRRLGLSSESPTSASLTTTKAAPTAPAPAPLQTPALVPTPYPPANRD